MTLFYKTSQSLTLCLKHEGVLYKGLLHNKVEFKRKTYSIVLGLQLVLTKKKTQLSKVRQEKSQQNNWQVSISTGNRSSIFQILHCLIKFYFSVFLFVCLCVCLN